MPWRDSLLELKAELTESRATRMARMEAFDNEVAAEREQLQTTHQELEISQLVAEMNEVLLDGQGETETVREWEDEVDDEDYDEDAADVITTALTWDEGEDLEVVCELVMLDEGLALMVNGVQIRLEREALEQALLDAFREQLRM